MKDVPNVGKLIDKDSDVKRDAIHIAVVPAIANENLKPGQRVGFHMNLGLTGIKNYVASANAPDIIGIVDPYLNRPVYQGQIFWVFVFPNTITSLRHEWTHPGIPENSVPEKVNVGVEVSDETMSKYKDQITQEIKEKTKEESMKWMRKFVQENRLGYLSDYHVDYDDPQSIKSAKKRVDDAVKHVLEQGKDGSIVAFGTHMDGERIPDEFWTHLEVLTGAKLVYKDEYFGCSC